MKKVILITLIVILSIVLVLSLCACGGKEEPAPTPVEIALSLIDHPVSELFAQIGEPESSDYAPSCMGEGEDGMLFYDGFIVYTYREGDVETVYDAE